jgi:O-succinylbenzoic acid--CoA ligase
MVVDLLAESAGRGNATALISDERVWTFDDLGLAVDKRVAELEADGLHAGGVVTTRVEPDSRGVIDLLAVWRLGAVPAPLNPRLSEAEFERARSTLRGAVVPAESQTILWTSGTSGQPRGVALSWANLAENAAGTIERLSLHDTDAWLLSLSPAHVGGLAIIVRSILLGSALFATGPYRTERISRLIDGPGEFNIQGRAVTHLSLVPTQLHQLLEFRGEAPPPPTLRCALIGGAHAPEGLVNRAREAGWPLALTYGATEMSSQISTAPPELSRQKPGTVGPPMPGVEVRITDDGEVETRGPTRALEYVGDVSAPLTDSLGWYRTGDMGRLDGDGHLWITGRRADRIVSGGVTIDAMEVEEAIRAHPSVIDACVVGVPDDVWGERVAAWVEPVVGEFDTEEVDAHLREVLSPGKVPRLWHVEAGLPRNANGKVDRTLARAVFGPATERA